MSDEGSPAAFSRVLKTAAIAFVLLLVVIAVLAWLLGRPDQLPFGYDGFGN